MTFMRNTNLYLQTALALCFSFFVYDNAHADKPILISTELSPSAKGPQQTFQIENTSKEPVNLTLRGTVAQNCSVSFDTASYTVDLVNGEADSTVATVTEICNDADGYSISLSSANSGVLQNDDNAGDQKAYTISYGSGISGQSLSKSRSVSYSSYTAGNAVPLRMDLSAHGAGVLAAGTWSDTVTISIAAL